MRKLPFALTAVFLAASGTARVRADEPPTPQPAPQPGAPAKETGPAKDAAPSADILRWVADLASDDFRTREAAQKKLAEAGESARAALESAAKTSDSLEVRWRAEQLLLRLEAPGARPLGEAGPEAPRAGPDADAVRRLFGADTPDAMREMFERLFRDMHRGGGFDPRSPAGEQRDPFEMFGSRLTAGDVTLILPFMGQGSVRLVVRGKDGTNVTHTGKSLEDILAAHPELKDAAGLADLQKQLAERKQRSDALLQGFTLGSMPSGSFRMSAGGVEVLQDASGAVVRITETGEDGKPKTTEYKGATLEEIKQKNPELAKHLGGFGSSFRIHIGPRMFHGPRDGGLSPLTPATPEAPPPAPQPDGVAFGLRLGFVEPVLAMHLGLEEGRGVLVDYVHPDSQAAQMGLERYDVIETIDSQPVTSRDMARQALRTAAKDKAPLTLGIIRTGKKQTLTR